MGEESLLPNGRTRRRSVKSEWGLGELKEAGRGFHTQLVEGPETPCATREASGVGEGERVLALESREGLETRPDSPGEPGMQPRDPCLPWRPRLLPGT